MIDRGRQQAILVTADMNDLTQTMATVRTEDIRVWLRALQANYGVGLPGIDWDLIPGDVLVRLMHRVHFDDGSAAAPVEMVRSKLTFLMLEALRLRVHAFVTGVSLIPAPE